MAKVSLLVGNNYSGALSLKGCKNDVDDMDLFLSEFGRVNTVLYDVNKTTFLYEFKGILTSGSNDIWIHFSGHGTQVSNHLESDGLDECIVLGSGNEYVSDGDILDYLRAYCRPEMTVRIVMDSCHSSGICDLPYMYLGNNRNRVRDRNRNRYPEGKVIMLSGCMESGTSSDSLIDGRWNGALTRALIETGKGTGTVLQKVRKWLSVRGYSQYPTVCSNIPLSDSDLIWDQ